MNRTHEKKSFDSGILFFLIMVRYSICSKIQTVLVKTREWSWLIKMHNTAKILGLHGESICYLYLSHRREKYNMLIAIIL